MANNDPKLPARVHEVLATASAPASPISIASLPSTPSSPPVNDESSIPGSPSSLASDLPISSLSSSLFLSGTSSPGPQLPMLEDLATRTFVIPSLSVPQYDPGRGDAVGNVKLWIIGAGLSECQAAAESIIRDAPLVSEVGDWIFGGDGIATLRASTLSSAQQSIPRSMHDTKWNVEAYVADVSIDSRAQPASMLDSILAAIQEPFISTDRLLNDSEPSTTSFLPLLTSSTTHLHTAIVYLRSSPSTRHDQVVINELSPYIPVISMPHSAIFAPGPRPQPRQTPSSSSSADSPATSTFRPQTVHQLRDSLFLNPSTLHHLRTEAGERFLRWRDLNAALRQPDSPTVHPLEVNNSREMVPSSSASGSRPQNRGRASSVSTVRSSGIIFSSSQSTPRITNNRPSLSGGAVRSPLAGVEEERQADWMWNWESRFSRDVQEQQQRQPLVSSTSTSSRPQLNSLSTARMPLAATMPRSTILELSNPAATLRDRRSPPILHDPSPARSSADEPDEPDDPLHLRSVARLAVSVVPALLHRYRIIGRRDTSRRRRHVIGGHITDRGGGGKDKGSPRDRGMSWGMFGLGVSVGVVLSICIVGIGMELSQRVWIRTTY